MRTQEQDFVRAREIAGPEKRPPVAFRVCVRTARPRVQATRRDVRVRSAQGPVGQVVQGEVGRRVHGEALSPYLCKVPVLQTHRESHEGDSEDRLGTFTRGNSETVFFEAEDWKENFANVTWSVRVSY